MELAHTEPEVLPYDRYRNVSRIAAYLRKRAELHDARLRAASLIIRDRMAGHLPHEIQQAIARARTVIYDGATIGLAVRYGLGWDSDPPEAA